MTTGAQLRDQGVADVLAADCSVTRQYAPIVHEAVEAIATHWHGCTFTAEDVRDWCERLHPGTRPHSHNVLPAVLKSLAESGRIVQAGYTTAIRPEARGRVLRLWRVVPKAGAR